MVTLERIFLWNYHPYREAEGLARERVGHWTILRAVATRPEIIISGSSRMPTYWTFQHLEEYIVSSLQYRVYSINLEKAEPRIPGVPMGHCPISAVDSALDF